MIAVAAIAPHGDPVFEEGSETGRALEEAGRRLEAAAPEVTIVLTPHNVHVEGAFGVVVAATVAGRVDEVALELSCETDRALAADVLAALRAAGLPAAGLSFGSNDPALAEHPMDWGVLIPLWAMGGRHDPPVPAVAISPARDLAPDAHVRAGRAVARAAADSGKRVALIASADHGHAHDPSGPYGFDPAAGEYDERIVELVKAERLEGLLDLDPGFVDAAKADSWWQLLMLHGALGDGWRGDFLTYEASTYFGMLCAAYAPN